MKFGFIGAGNVAQTISRHVLPFGHQVLLSNSRGPETLDDLVRTARARILVATPDESLRPGMFVHVKLEIPLGKKLAVPFDAVLDTGENQIVFAVKGAGTFQPRSVKLGRQADGWYEVLSGLEEGEEVVTSANFLIDSESRFRSALAAYGKKPPGSTTP